MRWRLPFLDRFRDTTSSSPQVTHVPEGHRIYAIGDVHGRFDLLVGLIERIKLDNRARGRAETHIIMLGDLIDRGPQSAHVIEYLRSQQGGFASFHFVCGNHEEAMLDSLAADATSEQTGWLGYGGHETMLSYGAGDSVFAERGPALASAMRDHIPDSHIAFIESFVDRVTMGDYLFVHAGIRPGIPIASQTTQDMRWIRDPFLEDPRDHGMMVVHGHTIREEPEVRANRIGIDTGAYRTGVLTALGLENDARWFLREGERLA